MNPIQKILVPLGILPEPPVRRNVAHWERSEGVRKGAFVRIVRGKEHVGGRGNRAAQRSLPRIPRAVLPGQGPLRGPVAPATQCFLSS